MFKRDMQFVWLLGLAAVGICAWAIAGDTQQDYRYYQHRFRSLITERFGEERATAVPAGVQQLWIPAANRTDRCTTCHLGVTWAGLEDVEQPFRSHPAEPLANHPIEQFGCTLCHGGQGHAVSLPDAHGWVKHWEDPLLDSRLAEDYNMKDAGAFIQIKCNMCHRYDRETAGADLINRGKQLINDKGCRACHTINGRGGRVGPDLTAIGDKSPEQYDYDRLTTLPTAFSWQVEHLKSPKSYSPDTVMPDFGFTTEDAQSLALLLMSWRDTELPASLIPGAQLKDLPTPEEAERERLMREGEGQFFVEKTCFICHDVSSLGIYSATKIGPDLALAVEDAPRRFGRTLDDFLMNPSGTMAVVLSTQIPLTDEEKREAIRLLKVAYEKHQNKQANGAATSEEQASGAAGTTTAPSEVPTEE